jgi:hypothetical protein
MRAFVGLCLFLAGAANTYLWEFIRAALYEKGLHMLSPHSLVDYLANYGLTAALVGGGVWLYWPSRPEILRWRPLRIFLEKDSVTDLRGIQTFPGISYIQPSITTSASLEKCRAWIMNSHFSPDGISPYALEHNERVPLMWSKHVGDSKYEAELHPGEPPVGINVAVFNDQGIAIDEETPTNWSPLLQRTGFHRLSIRVSGSGRLSRISETLSLTINWRSVGYAIVSLDEK